MYRKPRGSSSQSILNLDSLMDILSCLVGVMLFLVIYTVLELGSTSFQVTVPVPLDPPVGSRRVLVLANGGTVRVLDPGRPIRDLSTGIDQVPLDAMPEFVRQVNLSAPTDAYFRYTLDYDVEMASVAGRDRAFEITVDEIPGEPGEMLQELDPDSRYVSLLGGLEPTDVWIEFGVDERTLDAFRRARDLAEQRGFATRWGPLSLDFPVSFSLTDEAQGPGPRSTLSKR
jgi:hypothetical protein